MRWDEQAAVRADERRAMENALEIIRLRFTALFAADEEEDG